MKNWAFMLGLLALAALLALSLGARPVAPAAIWAALTAPDLSNPDHAAILNLRLPRLAAGLVAGGALGVAGALMQAVTRNPLAEPGLMGVNAGASLAVALGAALGLGSDPAALAFPGAAAATLAVFALGGARSGGLGPARLALAGMALNAFLLSAVTAIVLTSPAALDQYRFWAVGSLMEAATRPVAAMAVVAAAACLGALALGPALDALALGEDSARSLGLRVGTVRLAALGLTAALAGAAVILAGPLAFVGLMAPHLARTLVGDGARPSLAASGILGAAILLLCDVAGRLILPPGELRAGTMTALLGGAVFVAVARRLRLAALS